MKRAPSFLWFKIEGTRIPKYLLGKMQTALESNVFQRIEQKDRYTVTFTLSPTDVGYANALRRIILTGVESVAFRSDINDLGKTTDVEITKNSTPMTNEMLADRIGLLPIVFKNPLAWNPDKYEFRLSMENTTTDPMDIHAHHIEVYEKMADGLEQKIENTQFFNPDPIAVNTALLAVLKPKRAGQAAEAIEFTAKATIGSGREHARFNPVSQCTYKYTLDNDDSRRSKLFEQWLNKNKKVGDPRGLEKAQLEAYQREYNTMELNRCYLMDEKGQPTSYDFTIETVGTLDINYIVTRALEVGATMCAAYGNIHKESLPPDLRVSPADGPMEGYDFLFLKQDHTLGNLLQTYIDAKLMDRDGSKVTYVSYKVPHPLRDEMILRIGIDGGEESAAREVLAEAARELAGMFTRWRGYWFASLGTQDPKPKKPVIERGVKTAVKRANGSVAPKKAIA
jgi:DNA-directed RNA polymerase II subunit RPB3